MRPIVSFCGSPVVLRHTNSPSSTILQPLTDKSRHKIQSTEDFISATKTVQIPDDYKLVSFDVKSLFTSIPLQLALQFTETAILQSTDRVLYKLTKPLPDNNLVSVQVNSKQLHGTAIGSPVSVVVAEIVMQHRGKRPFDLPINDTALVSLR